MCNVRIICCTQCGSEGRLFRSTSQRDEYGNEMLHEEECPTCNVTGGEIIETEPVTQDDLAAIPDAVGDPSPHINTTGITS